MLLLHLGFCSKAGVAYCCGAAGGKFIRLGRALLSLETASEAFQNGVLLEKCKPLAPAAGCLGAEILFLVQLVDGVTILLLLPLLEP